MQFIRVVPRTTMGCAIASQLIADAVFINLTHKVVRGLALSGVQILQTTPIRQLMYLCPDDLESLDYNKHDQIFAWSCTPDKSYLSTNCLISGCETDPYISRGSLRHGRPLLRGRLLSANLSWCIRRIRIHPNAQYGSGAPTIRWWSFHREDVKVEQDLVARPWSDVPITRPGGQTLAWPLIIRRIIGRGYNARLLTRDISTAVSEYRFGHFENISRLETTGHVLLRIQRDQKPLQLMLYSPSNIPHDPCERIFEYPMPLEDSPRGPELTVRNIAPKDDPLCRGTQRTSPANPQCKRLFCELMSISKTKQFKRNVKILTCPKRFRYFLIWSWNCRRQWWLAR